MEHRHVDEDRYAPGLARKISCEDRRLRTQSRRCLRARARQRPQLQTWRPNQLLCHRCCKETCRLRKRQARFKLRSTKPRRKYRLLHRQARRLNEEIHHSRSCTSAKAIAVAASISAISSVPSYIIIRISSYIITVIGQAATHAIPTKNIPSLRCSPPASAPKYSRLTLRNVRSSAISFSALAEDRLSASAVD